MSGKFTKTDDLKEDFDNQKVKLASIKKMIQDYKSSLQKHMTYHSMKHDTKKNQIV